MRKAGPQGDTTGRWWGSEGVLKVTVGVPLQGTMEPWPLALSPYSPACEVSGFVPLCAPAMMCGLTTGSNQKVMEEWNSQN